MEKHKVSFEVYVDYYLYITKGQQRIFTIPAPETYRIDGVRAEVSVYFDQVPDSLYTWDYLHNEWKHQMGEKLSNKVTFPIPFIAEGQ